MYESVQPTGVSDALLWHRLGAKTLEFVHGYIEGVRVTGTGLDEVIVDAETIDAIRQLALDGARVPPEREPITVGEAIDTIGARIRRRLEGSGHPTGWSSPSGWSACGEPGSGVPKRRSSSCVPSSKWLARSRPRSALRTKVALTRSHFTGWQTSQPGDCQVRVELRKTLAKHALPTTGELFDRAYAYIRENH